MTRAAPRFYFDYVDPLSYLVETELRAWEATGPEGARVLRTPYELRPPPAPLLDPDGPEWRARWERARALARRLDVDLTPPALVPWSRKAHELLLHAREHEAGEETHRALFAAAAGARDLGRVDVLVEIATGVGLDLTETKAALDVDRFSEDVAALRAAALEAGVAAPPTLWADGELLEGFHNRDEIGKFLAPAP